MDRILVDLGIFQIKWYSFFIFLALICGLFIVFKEAKKKNINEDLLVNLCFYSFIFAIIGARLYYVLFNLEYYMHNPLEIIMVWNGGLAIHGGIIAGLIFLIYYSKKHSINILLMIDILVVGLIIGQAIGRWGNFFNSEAFGRITTENALSNMHIPKFIIKGMNIDGNYREPTFFYESVMSVIGFIIMIVIRKIKTIKTGMITSFYLIWYGIVRFIIEVARSDSLMVGNFKIAQIISLLFIITGIIVFIKSKKNNKLYGEDTIIVAK